MSELVEATAATAAGAPLTMRISRPLSSRATVSANLAAGSKRREVHDLERRAPAARSRGHRSDHGVDWVLAVRRTGERGQAEDIRPCDAVRAAAHRRDGQLVSRQGAGFVGAQHVDHRRLVQA
jgi:hypothetical protein